MQQSNIDVGRDASGLAGVKRILYKFPDSGVDRSGWAGEACDVSVSVEEVGCAYLLEDFGDCHFFGLEMAAMPSSWLALTLPTVLELSPS